MTKRALDRLADIEAADKWAEELTQKGTLGNLAVLRFMTVSVFFRSFCQSANRDSIVT